MSAEVAGHRYILRELIPRRGIVAKELDVVGRRVLTSATDYERATFEAEVPLLLHQDLKKYLSGMLGEGTFVIFEEDSQIAWTLVGPQEFTPNSPGSGECTR